MLNIQSLNGMLVDVDPIRFLRQAKLIIENGNMPANDISRAFPVGCPSNNELTLFPYLMAYAYQFLSLFSPELSLNQVATIYPVIFSAIACIMLYILAKQLTDKNVALLVISISAVVPPLVKRSLAGFADRDIMSLVLGFASYYFYVKAYEPGSLRKSLYMMGSSGILMGMLGLTWQGAAIFSLVIVGIEILTMLFGSYSKRAFYMYSAWVIPMLLILILPKHVYRNVSEPFVLISVIVPGSLIIFGSIYLFSHRIFQFISSRQLMPFIISGFSLIVIVTLVIFHRVLSSLIVRIWQGIQYPLGADRLLKVIGELQPQGLNDWLLWPGFFFLAVLGGIFLLAYRLSSKLGINKWSIGVVLQIVVAAIILSRVLSGVYAGKNTFTTNMIYISSMVMLLVTVIGAAIYLRLYRRWQEDNYLDRKALFLIVYLITTLVFARAANRFEFFLAPVSLIAGCYALCTCIRWLIGNRALNNVTICTVILLAIWEFYTLASMEFVILSEWGRMLLVMMMILFSIYLCWLSLRHIESMKFHHIFARVVTLVIMAFIILLSAVTPYSYAKTSYTLVYEVKPIVNSNMKEALIHIKEQTPEDAVVAAYWEWGSAINLITERATILDDSQILYWVYLMSRNVMMGQTEYEALEFLKAHQATHLMLTARDVYILPEVSYIADRQISLQVYGSVVQRVKSDAGTVAFRYGTSNPVSVPEIRSLLQENNPETWKLIGVYLSVDGSSKPQLRSAIVEFQKGNQILRFPPCEIYFRRSLIYNRGKTAPGAILISAESNDPFEWSILYLSPIARNSMAVRLYLMDEPSEFFSPVYYSNDPDGQSVKVWKVKYPKDMVVDPGFLQLDFPGSEPK